MVSLAPLEIKVTADTARAEAGLERVQGQLQDTGQAATRSAGKVRTAGMAMGAVGPAAAKANPALRNMSMQLSQVAQQGAVTGNYLQALITQVPDLALGFGAVGIAAGALVPIVYGVGQAFFASGEQAKESTESILTSYRGLASAADAVRDAQDRYTAAIRLSGDVQSEITPQVIANLQQELAARQALFDLERAEFELRRLSLQQTIEASRARIEALVAEETAMLDLTEANNGFYRSQADRGRLEIAQQIVATRREEVTALRRNQAELDLINALLAGNLGEVNRIVDAEIEAAARANEVGSAWESVKGIIESISLDGIIAQAGDLASQAWNAADGFQAAWSAMQGLYNAERTQMAGLAAQYEAYGQGQQAFAQGASEIRYAPQVSRSAPSGGGGGGGAGGGGGVNPIIAELEAVQQALMTQEELQIQSFERQQETLQSALEQQLLTRQEFNELVADSENQHSIRMGEIHQAQAEMMLSAYSGALGEASNLLGQFTGESKAAAIAQIAINKSLAIAQIVQNTAVAKMRALAELGPVAGAAAAARIGVLGKIQAGLAAATGFAQAANAGGGGGGFGSVAAPAAAQQAQTTQQVSQFNVVIEGQSISTGQFGNLIDQINEEARNGGRIFIRAIEG